MSNSNSYLCGSRDFHVETLTVINASPPTTTNAFACLHDSIAIDAVHNSEERYDAPRCHPETRMAVQEEILSWITHGDADTQPMKILWLTGPAGTGKTAILGSVADTCEESGVLAGSFFFASFTGSEARRSKRCFVATLVYHLILPLDEQHPLRKAILLAVQKDPSIFRRRLKDQLRVLLVKPLRDTRGQFDPADLPRAFFVDGLDEVEAVNSRQSGRDQHEVRLENERDQEDILSTLLYAADTPSFPFRFVIASRPERAIRSFLMSHANHLTRTIFLDEKYDPDSDIKLFLVSKLAEVRRRYALPISWPSPRVINELVQAASGQFIYIATIIRFIHDSKGVNPQALLCTVLDWRSQDSPCRPLAALDALYTRIIMSSSDPFLVAKWFGAIRRIGSGYPALFVNQVLQQDEGEARCVLENQASLLSMPAAGDEASPYKFYHRSLFDYFDEVQRCGVGLVSAFDEGDDFLFSCFGRAFKNRAPAYNVSETESLYFMRLFLGSPRVWLYHPFDRRRWKVSFKIVDCDVSWWLHTAIVVVPKEVCQQLIQSWFRLIHFVCPSDSPGSCTPICNHWRSNLLRMCRDLGWKVPNDMVLIREAMVRHASIAFTFTATRSGGRQVQALSSDVPEEPLISKLRETPATNTLYTIDKSYQASLKFVSAALARLPDNWEVQYKELKEGGKTPSDAIASIIEPIAIDLGIPIGVDEDQSSWCWYPSFVHIETKEVPST